MILEMRKDIQVVEDKLGRVGEGCGRESVGRGVRGLGKLYTDGEKAGHSRGSELEWVAKVKGLSSCVLVIGRLLKKAVSGGEEKGKSLVLAAKVLVLSRLLAKSVGDLAEGRGEESKDVVEELKRKLATLRRRLLRTVERIIQRIGDKGNREDILQALAAYSLATSSGAKDVLRHFLHVRGEAIALAFEDEDDGKKEAPGVLRALGLYTATLLDVQALVPRRLSEALAGLKTKALLKDATVREIEGLRLDVGEKWFGSEISYFTPYIRHDDLDGPQAVDTLKGWSKRASEVLLQGLAQALERTSDFTLVVELRTKILEIWIKEGGKAKGFDPSILLGGLRKVINARLVELLETRVSKLHLVGTEIEATLGSWRPGVTDKHDSIWDDTILEMETSNGAGLFKEAILARSYGRNDAVHRVSSGYRTWRHLVDEVITFVEQLKKQRWDDDLEDIEDDLAMESRSILLSQEDPQLLQSHLNSSLESNYKQLHEKIGMLLSTFATHESIGQISIYALRIIRDIRSEIPDQSTLQSFGLSLVPALHQRLAIAVGTQPITGFSKSLRRKRVTGRALWEGSPELPVQPSPATFKFLRTLSSAIGDVGSDLWSTNAVKVLKRHIANELEKQWKTHLDGSEESKVNGSSPKFAAAETVDGDVKPDEDNTNSELEETESEEAVKFKQELLTQSLFDLFVLQNALTVDEDELEDVGKKIEGILELEAGVKKRLHNGARQYWRKTNLLFGLLA